MSKSFKWGFSWIGVLILMVISHLSCGTSTSDNPLRSDDYGSLAPTISYKRAVQQLIISTLADSVRLRVTTADGFSKQITVAYQAGRITLNGIPIGLVDLTVEGLDRTGTVVYRGQSQAVVSADAPAQPTVIMEPTKPLLIGMTKPAGAEPFTFHTETLECEGLFDGTDSLLSLTLNDIAVQRLADHRWTHTLHFADGMHKLVLKAKTAGGDSMVVEHWVDSRDTTAPILTISPPSPFETTADSAQIQVAVQDRSGIKMLRIGDDTLELQEGATQAWVYFGTSDTLNVFVEAIDNSRQANKTLDSIVVIRVRAQDKQGPTLVISVPSERDTTIAQGTVLVLEGSVSDAPSGVASLTIAGKSVTWDALSGQWETSVDIGALDSLVVPLQASDRSDNVTYDTVIVRRQPPTIAKPTLCAVSSPQALGEPTITGAFKRIEMTVADTATAISLIVTACNPQNLLRLENHTITSAEPSPMVTLKTDVDSFTLTVLSALDTLQQLQSQVIVRRQAHPAAPALSSLQIAQAQLEPAFSPQTTTYQLTVPHAVELININALAHNSADTILITRDGVSSGSAIALNVGQTLVTVTVKRGQPQLQTVYTVTIVRELPTLYSTELKSLSVSTGLLSPPFDKAVSRYVDTLFAEESTLTIHAVPADSNASLEIRHANQLLPGPWQLSAERDSVTIKVIAPDASSRLCTLVTIRRPYTSFALAALEAADAQWDTAFNPLDLNYRLTVDNTVDKITLKARATSSGATVHYTREDTETDSVITLGVGETNVQLTVEGKDASQRTVYSITILREPQRLAKLVDIEPSVGTVDTVSVNGQRSFTIALPYATDTLSLKLGASSPLAKIRLDGTLLDASGRTAVLTLNVGNNPHTITVIAQDTTLQQSYTLTIVRAQNSSAHLNLLEVSVGTLTPAFASATKNYQLRLPHDVSLVKLRPHFSGVGAGVRIAGAVVDSGVFSTSLSAAQGTGSTIDVVVSAMDGTVQGSYQVTLVRGYRLELSTDGNGQLNPATTSYSAYAGDTVKVTALANTGYDFKNWTKVSGSATIVDASQPQGKFLATADCSIRAIFALKNYELGVFTQGGGTVSGGGTVQHGIAQTIIATPSLGYEFVRWQQTNGTVTFIDNLQATTGVTLKDGEAIVEGVFQPITFSKFTANGTIQKSKCVIQALNGDYIIAGTSDNGPNGGRDIVLTRLKVNGSEVWTKYFGTAQDDDVLKVLYNAADDGFFLIGGDNDQMTVTKVNTSGTKEWSVTSNVEFGFYATGAALRGSRLVVVGDSPQGGDGDPCVVTVAINTTTLAIEWSNVVQTGTHNTPRQIIAWGADAFLAGVEIDDNNSLELWKIAIGGTVTQVITIPHTNYAHLKNVMSDANDNAVVLVDDGGSYIVHTINQAGSIISSITLSSLGAGNQIRSSFLTADGNLVIVGENTADTKTRGLIAQFSATGSLTFQRLIADPYANQYFTAGCATVEGGLMAVGDDSYHMVFVKTDAAGELN